MHQRASRSVLVGALVLAGLGAFGQRSGVDHLKSKIDSIANRAIEIQAAPGIQVMVMQHDSVVLHETYGYHTYDALLPVSEDDIYDIASITKIAASTAVVMKLMSDGKFDLDTTLSAYLPEFKKSDKGDLIWRDILAHNARLQAWIPYWESTVKRNGTFKRKTFRAKPSKRFPTEVTPELYLHRNYQKDIYKAIKHSPLNEEGGYVYSGLAFYLIPEVVKRLTGQEFEDFVRSEIYEPIGAATMRFNPLRYYSPEQIIPTERDTFFRKTQIHGRVHDEGAAMMGGISGNAGLFSSCGDLAKLACLFLNRGIAHGDTIIDPKVVDEFTRCQFCDTGNHRGLGFDKPIFTVDPEATSVSVSPVAGPHSYGHSGYTGTLLWIEPDEDVVFIFLSNRVYQTRLNRKLYTENIRPAMMAAIYDWARSK